MIVVFIAFTAAAVARGGTLLIVGHDITNPSEGWGGPRDPDVLYGPDVLVRATRPMGTP
jgi:hypothetical protein